MSYPLDEWPAKMPLCTATQIILAQFTLLKSPDLLQVLACVFKVNVAFWARAP
jgi:hypothetical protein